METFNYDVCDVCGADHDTEQCPELILDEDDLLDDSTAFQSSRACVTLPHFLSLVVDDDGLLSVVAKEVINVRMRFGPFEARRTTRDIDTSNAFILKVFLKDGSAVCLDTSDPAGCNWLCLVPTAHTTLAQNMMAVQIGLDVFYTVTKPIAVGDGLRVWYAPHYARKLGQSTTPQEGTEILLGRELLPPMVSSVTNMTDCVTMPIMEVNINDVPPVAMTDVNLSPDNNAEVQVAFDTAGNADIKIAFETDDKTYMESRDVQMNTDSTNCPLPRESSTVEDPLDIPSSMKPELIPEEDSIDMIVNSLAKPRCLHIIHEERPENPTQTRQCIHCDMAFDDMAELACHVREHIVQQMKGQGRGRPPKRPCEDDDGGEVVRRKRGRPRGSKTKNAQKKSVEISKQSLVNGEVVTNSSELPQNADSSSRVKQEGVIPLVLPPRRGRPRKSTVAFVDITDSASPADVKTTGLGAENAPDDLLASLISMQGIDLVPVEDEAVGDNRGEEGAVTAGKGVANDGLMLSLEKDLPTDKGFSCQYCNRSFQKLIYLQRHEAAHINCYQCTQCGKRYTSKDSLLNHACPVQGKANSSERSFFCEFCGSSFNSHKYLLRHMATHTREHACTRCGRAFVRKESLVFHLSRCDPQQLPSAIYPCDKCKRVFTRELSLQNHMHLHKGTFKCDRCGHAFSSQFSLDRHGFCSGPLAVAVGSLKCRVCEREFTRELYLRRHMAIHTRQFTCKLCDRRFARQMELTKHTLECSATIQVQTTGKIICAMCEMEFVDVSKYVTHYAQHTHPYSCEKCDKVFLRKVNLESHTCLSVTPVDCDQCGRQFRNQKYLSRHQLSHGEPQHTCADCGRSFFRIDYYNDHMCVTETGERVRIRRKKRVDGSEDGVKEIVTTNEALVCPVCGKSYISTSNLNKHMKTHGDKLETCHVCGKSFHLKVALREHLQSVHTNEFKHECPQCGKRMKCRNSVYAHIAQFHAPVSPKHVCTECGRGFRQRGNLKKHMQTHITGRSAPQHGCAKCKAVFRSVEQLAEHDMMCHQLDALPLPQMKSETPFVIADIQSVNANGETSTHHTVLIQSSHTGAEHVTSLQGLMGRQAQMMLDSGGVGQIAIKETTDDKSGIIMLPMFTVQATDDHLTLR